MQILFPFYSLTYHSVYVYICNHIPNIFTFKDDELKQIPFTKQKTQKEQNNIF